MASVPTRTNVPQVRPAAPSAAPSAALPRPFPIKTTLQADINPWWIVSGTLLVLGTASMLVYVRTGRR